MRFLLSTHYSHYNPWLFWLNLSALLIVLFPKLPIVGGKHSPSFIARACSSSLPRPWEPTHRPSLRHLTRSRDIVSGHCMYLTAPFGRSLPLPRAVHWSIAAVVLQSTTIARTWLGRHRKGGAKARACPAASPALRGRVRQGPRSGHVKSCRGPPVGCSYVPTPHGHALTLRCAMGLLSHRRFSRTL